MPNFIGFSTINKDKKFTLVDYDLIKRDLLNAFMIRGGTLPGRPEVGTRIWDYIFDPNDNVMTNKIDAEVRRIISRDRRLVLNELSIASTANTIRITISVDILPDHSSEEFYLTFLLDSQTATLV